jgi:nitrogen fixation protein
MSNSYRTLIERLRQFADGHYIIQKFYHGQIDAADLDKEPRYPMMHVLPVDIRASEGTLDYALEIRFADIGRDKEIKTDYQKEIISDMSRLALSLISEIENGQVLFGEDAEIVDKQATIIPFIEEFTHVLTGVQLNVTIRLPYDWSACDIPADYSPNITDNPDTGSGILTKIGIYNDGDFVGYTSFLDFSDDFNVTVNGNKIEVTLVGGGGGGGVLTAIPFSTDHISANGNAYAIGDVVYYSGNVYRCIANNDAILPTNATYWTNLGAGYPLVERPSDWNATSGNNQILNKPTIPTLTSDLTNDGEDGVNPFITANDLPSLTGYVPYTGATTDVDLGTHNLTADHIALNVNPSGAGFVVGATQWNNTIGSSQTLLKGGNVTLKNGVDLVARIVNKVTPNTTLTKANYQAVRVSGATGGRMSVELAQANNDLNSADTIGLVCETIATNKEGFIITVGQLLDINTTGSLQGETWVDGDVLYLSPTTAGQITKVKPTGAGHIVVIGYVEYAHAVNGAIYVKVMNGWELDELHDVDIISPATNDILYYDSDGLWKNKQTVRIFETTSNITTSSTTRADVTELTVPMLAGKKYKIELYGMVQSPAVTTGCSVGFYISTGTATINGIIRGLVQTSASTTALDQFIYVLTTTAGAAGSFFTTSGVGAINTPHALGGSFYVESASDCDFKFQFGSEVAASTTLLSGSALIVTLIN